MHGNYSNLRLGIYADLRQRIEVKTEFSIATLAFLATYT